MSNTEEKLNKNTVLERIKDMPDRFSVDELLERMVVTTPAGSLTEDPANMAATQGPEAEDPAGGIDGSANEVECKILVMIRVGKPNAFSIFATFVVLLLIVYHIYVSNNEKMDIDSHLKSTIGIILKYHTGPNGVSYVTYSYVVEGKKYRGSSSKEAFRGCEQSGWCIGAKLTIEYSSIHPENNRINWNDGYVLSDPADSSVTSP